MPHNLRSLSHKWFDEVWNNRSAAAIDAPVAAMKPGRQSRRTGPRPGAGADAPTAGATIGAARLASGATGRVGVLHDRLY